MTRVVLLLLILGLAPRVHAGPEWDGVDEVIARLPSRCESFVLIPNLKRLSDRFTETLESMDRAQLLLGSRPIDQLKSALGIVSNVDDHRGGAIAFVPHDDGGHVPRILFVVPVTDPEAFVDANLVATDEPGRYLLAASQPVHVRADGDFVVLSLDVPLPPYTPLGMDGARRFREMLHPEDGESLRTAYLTVYASRAGSRWVTGLIPALVPGARAPQWLSTLPDGVTYGVGFIRVDAIAVATTVIFRCDPESELGRACAGGGPASGNGLRRLAARKYYLVAGIDMEGFGGQSAYDALRRFVPLPELPASLLGADRIELAAYAPANGPSGALVTDAVAVLETSAPDEIRRRLRADVEALPESEGPVTWTASWRSIDEPDGAAIDAIEVRGTLSPDAPPDVVRRHAILSLLFGPSGIRTQVARTDGALVMGLGRDRTRLKRFMDAANGAERVLDDDAAIGVLRTWLPERTDLEAYLGTGAIAETLEYVRPWLATLGAEPLPQLDPSLPPVAVALEVEKGALRGAIVLPSTVLGVLMDEARRRVQRSMLADDAGDP